MTAKECVNNVGDQHIFPLDALIAVSVHSRKFQNAHDMVTFVKMLLEVQGSYRNRINAEILGAWKIVCDEIDLSRFDIAAFVNFTAAESKLVDEESQWACEKLTEVLNRSKADGGYGYCDDCAKRAVVYFCTPPWETVKA